MTGRRDAPASNQMEMQLPGLTTEGRRRMEEARAWVARHPDEWRWYMQEARDATRRGYASTNLITQAMRHRFRVKVPNALAPCFARIAMEQDAGVRFKTARSMSDGFTKAVLG